MLRTLLSPRLLGAHLVAAAAVGIAIWLGMWQVHAWEAKRAADALDVTRLKPVALTEAMGPDDSFPGKRLGHPVVVEGTWMPEATLYISGREHDGRDGYWAATPVLVPATGSAVYVVRGWTADPASAPSPPDGETETVVWLQPGEGTGEMDEDPTDDVLPQLRLADAIQHVDVDLYGGYGIVADKGRAGTPVGDAAVNPGTEGLAPATPDQLPQSSRFTALRNLLYGFQWWFFGGFAVFIWWRFCADEVARDRAERRAPSAAASAAGPTEAASSDDEVPSEP